MKRKKQRVKCKRKPIERKKRKFNFAITLCKHVSENWKMFTCIWSHTMHNAYTVSSDILIIIIPKWDSILAANEHTKTEWKPSRQRIRQRKVKRNVMIKQQVSNIRRAITFRIANNQTNAFRNVCVCVFFRSSERTNRIFAPQRRKKWIKNEKAWNEIFILGECNRNELWTDFNILKTPNEWHLTSHCRRHQ